jgi:hypothetical protein
MTTGKKKLTTEKATDYIAYILVRAAPGTASEVAQKMSLIGDPNKGGVYWAVVLAGPNDILAGVRVSDRAWLAEYVQEIQQIDISGVKAVRRTLTQVAVDFYPGPPRPGVGFP